MSKKMMKDKDKVLLFRSKDIVESVLYVKGATGTLFRCCFILGNIFNLPDADGKAMLCSYFSAPDLPEPGLRLG